MIVEYSDEDEDMNDPCVANSNRETLTIKFNREELSKLKQVVFDEDGNAEVKILGKNIHQIFVNELKGDVE